MRKISPKTLLAALLFLALAYSFWFSPSWLQLCYGLALFLFGMQCIEEGLHNAAGGTLEHLMEKTTASPQKGLLFGMFATFILQSSTLVSLLTIAFLSTGLITLAGGIAILLGTNIGATSGIWLLALAGQSISLSPIAVPILVFGILASFFNSKTKAVGRVLVGISLIFLGIDAIKSGFNDIGSQVDFANIQVSGPVEIAIFTGIGLLLTLVLQSSHATLILTLAALAGGQISIAQGFAVAIGSNVGSSASTAFVGMFSSERNGQRLALAHLIFNCITAILSLILWLPLTRLVTYTADLIGLNSLLQLALFHTLFNLLGLATFWKIQQPFAARLRKWLPDKAKQELQPERTKKYKPLYLNENMLKSGDTALRALFKEIRHLNDLGVDVICHALYVPPEQIDTICTTREIPPPEQKLELNVQSFYDAEIKPIYSSILDFASKINIEGSENGYQEPLNTAHLAAFKTVEVIKESKHLQKNMHNVLSNPESPVYQDYMTLREQLVKILCLYHHTLPLAADENQWGEQSEQIQLMQQSIHEIEALREAAFSQLRQGLLTSWQVSSLMNDINYARFIGSGLLEILQNAGKELA